MNINKFSSRLPYLYAVSGAALCKVSCQFIVNTYVVFKAAVNSLKRVIFVYSQHL